MMCLTARLLHFGLCLFTVTSLVAAFSHHAHSSDDEQVFAIEPQDQVAVVGSRAILPCRVLNKKGVLQWTKDDFGLGTRRRLPAFDRYSMIGSDDEGDFSLQIYPVTLDDEAQYQCQVGPGQNGEHGIRSNYATLSVMISPDPPRILQGDFIAVTEGQEIDIECVSENGKPAAEITWIDGSENVLTAGVEYVKEPSSSDTRRFTAKSILKLKANKGYHNKTIICQAQNSVDKTYRSTGIRLEVKYTPQVKIMLIEGALDTGQVPEGNTVKLRCAIDAFPSDVAFQWFTNDGMVIDATDNELEIKNVTRIFQNTSVKCQAQNIIGANADVATLDVIYPPSFKNRPENIEAESYENVTLSCIVDANPPADIIWVFDPIDRMNFQPRVVGVSSTLHLIASNETAGRYYCKAHSVGFQEISAEAAVILRGPPKILSSSEQHPVDDDTYEVECRAQSVPRAKHVSWAFNGALIDLDTDTGFSLRQDLLYDGVKSTLRIEENHAKHFGVYSCTVINKYGSDTLHITFTSRKRIPLVLIASGSCLISLIMIGGCVGACCCIHRRQRCRRQQNEKRELPPADIIPKVIQPKTNSLKKKNATAQLKFDATPAITDEHDYQESISGSYSTTTTLSMNKTDLLAAKMISIPTTIRYSGNFIDGLGSANQSITGSYVDYARDYYTPSMQNANNFFIQSTIRRGDSPTFV